MGWVVMVAGSTSGVSPKSIRRPSSPVPTMFEFANESKVANANLFSNAVTSMLLGPTGAF